jgi:hypothetical protein
MLIIWLFFFNFYGQTLCQLQKQAYKLFKKAQDMFYILIFTVSGLIPSLSDLDSCLFQTLHSTTSNFCIFTE